MRSARIAVVTAGVIATLAVVPISTAAQGKSGSAPGKNRAAPPASSTVSTPATAGIATGTSTAAAPFAWLDDASVMAPGNVWVGVSMVHWQGAGASQSLVPVVDAAFGVAPRVQMGATVPRTSDGLGTTFFGAKIAVLEGDPDRPSLAVAPTLEISSGAASDLTATARRRTQWGIPVSAQFERAGARIYGSSGYFSPGIWFAGGGASRSLTDRVGVSVSFSRAWTVVHDLDPSLRGPRRNDVSGGGFFDLTPNLSVFGSVGRTIRTAADDGAGTTFSFGMSLNAQPRALFLTD
jgi:hypothetical protein